MTPLPRPCVCLVTDRRRLAPDARTQQDELVALERQLDEAIGAGIDLIHVRETDLEAAVLRGLASRISSRAGAATRVVVNDRADVALAAGADGVHLRGDGPRARRVRELGPPEWIVGRSVHSSDEAAASTDADYLIFGSVFITASKPVGSRVTGLAALCDASTATSAPVLAIGGVTLANIADCRAAGAAGIAAIGLFLDRLGQTMKAIRNDWTSRT